MGDFVVHQCDYARCRQRHPAHAMEYHDGRWFCRKNHCLNLYRAEKLAHEKNGEVIGVDFSQKAAVQLDFRHFGAN